MTCLQCPAPAGLGQDVMRAHAVPLPLALTSVVLRQAPPPPHTILPTQSDFTHSPVRYRLLHIIYMKRLDAQSVHLANYISIISSDMAQGVPQFSYQQSVV